ncbi:uncharacterized protein LOC112342761 [Selaginella moellendorffii]|uniref:uncharacterized protein LOC112342761 n=1 Tax=Selaginella moellendorffii TaxID=88036 RepID=UPI000D1CE0CA|nr:uncharacterized protein LOC112342761 [Selaginella moellendorffii]|eukprot:XP_024520826.1 uncharacterized protein LOC112342761 [Selaginella moellendorffii]
MASSIKEQWRRLDDLPDELLVRIISRLLSSRHLHCCSLVSKRWKDLARCVTHFCLDSSNSSAEEGLIRWFHPDHGNNLRYLDITRFPCYRKNVSSTRWLQVLGKTLHSLRMRGLPNQKFEDFWSSLSECHELRCLHIYANVGTALPPTMALRNLLYCVIFVTVLDVSAVQQLLEECPSLIFFCLGSMAVPEESHVELLKSSSLDCLEIRSRCGGAATIAIDMPKLRWLTVSSGPCVELRPSTCNIEWVQLHGRVRHQGLCHSLNKLKSITLSNSFRSPANVLERVLPLVPSLGGVKELSLLVGDHDFQPRSFKLAVFLELFHGLEVLRIARTSIKALSLDEWSSRQSPLMVFIEAAFRSESGGIWESDDIDFLWELMRSSECVRLLDLRGFVYRYEPPDFRPQVPAAFEVLSQAFPGRIKVHPLLFDVPAQCRMLWRTQEARFKSEPPYTAIQHWCKHMHSMETFAFEGCAWQ